jgi:hypothetical protein
VPFKIERYTNAKDEGECTCTPLPTTMIMVNLMTNSAESYNTVQKITINIDLTYAGIDNWRAVQDHGKVMFDFSKLDRLTVHRRIRTLEVKIVYPKDPEDSVKGDVENLMDELDNIGKALVPGHAAVRTGPTSDPDLLVGCFLYKFRAV